jgi:hypothetical protein
MDPITIGLAFTAAQQAVSGIKQAMALGKDVKNLYGQFANFFENGDKIHIAHNKIKAGISELTDGQIRSLSLQIALQSKALREAEIELRDMLIWSGNKDVWDEMQRERLRMIKERNEREAALKKAKAEGHVAILDKALMFIVFSILLSFIYGIGMYMLTKR